MERIIVIICRDEKQMFNREKYAQKDGCTEIQYLPIKSTSADIGIETKLRIIWKMEIK